jgi:ABC-type Zn uptake system ZnuABC Zn-binding protein ZnuA
MIKRILEIRIPLTLAIADCSKAASALNAENYAVLENLVTILSPFEDATKQIFGEQYVTISLVIPFI